MIDVHTCIYRHIDVHRHDMQKYSYVCAFSKYIHLCISLGISVYVCLFMHICVYTYIHMYVPVLYIY